jgi:hypothetical protein
VLPDRMLHLLGGATGCLEERECSGRTPFSTYLPDLVTTVTYFLLISLSFIRPAPRAYYIPLPSWTIPLTQGGLPSLIVTYLHSHLIPVYKPVCT